MEVTDEMRAAVRASDAAIAKQYEQECHTRYAEWCARMESALMDKVRRVVPNLTSDQFEEIYSAFSDHFYELNR